MRTNTHAGENDSGHDRVASETAQDVVVAPDADVYHLVDDGDATPRTAPRCRPREHEEKTVVSRAWVNCSERELCEHCLEVSEQ